MVAVSALPVSATLGISKPLLVAVMSKAEEANGDVVPMPTWAKIVEVNSINKLANTFNFLIVNRF